jgi:hypothetical protein
MLTPQCKGISMVYKVGALLNSWTCTVVELLSLPSLEKQITWNALINPVIPILFVLAQFALGVLADSEIHFFKYTHSIFPN